MSAPVISYRLASLALLIGLGGAAQAALEQPSALRVDEILNNISVYIEHKDCPGAIGAMNKGLAQQIPSVMLMAGAMYEEGICLKQNWDQAAHYYQLAIQAGSYAARSRFIAGLAYQNRDPAAALWWAGDAPTLPEPCRSAKSLHDNPDAFVQAINAWPAGQLAACVYVLGVVRQIAGDVEFPGRALTLGISAKIVMQFAPATGQVKWIVQDMERLTITREVPGDDQDGRMYRQGFLKPLQRVSERALRRFERPTGIDPVWLVQMTYNFVTVR